jgi:hypothetical protein
MLLFYGGSADAVLTVAHGDPFTRFQAAFSADRSGADRFRRALFAD